MSREAMKQALEALEYEAEGWEDVPPITRDAITTLRKALETEQKPVISTDHGPWIPSTHPGEEGETYCKRCLLRDKFFGSRQCDPHIVYRDPPQQKPVGDDRVMTVVYRNVQKEDAQSFTDHPKAVWFGWCHAPYQRDDAIFKLEKAITSPPASKPWVGLTTDEMKEIADRYHLKPPNIPVAFRAIEAKLKERNG